MSSLLADLAELAHSVSVFVIADSYEGRGVSALADAAPPSVKVTSL